MSQCWLLLLCILCPAPHFGSGRTSAFQQRCPTPDVIPNGSFRLKRSNSVMRITCRTGYSLLGPRLIECVHGKWYGEKPVCARKGCSMKPENPENGHVQIERELMATLYCDDNFKLAGNRFTYCNGTTWDRKLGTCRENKNAIEHECDFETEDLCGWACEAQTGIGRLEWKRVMAANVFTSFATGPRHDHTFLLQPSGGHYMLMESLGSKGNEEISLLSPIYKQALSLKTACCFRFYYFMYGASVGTLSVYVRPITISIQEIMEQDEYKKFSKSGSQNNIWNEAFFDIEEMPTDFQIIFMASAGQTHLSDIAIDDVKLMMGIECKDKFATENSSDPDETIATEAALFDTQSCASRCEEKTPHGFGSVQVSERIFGLCECHELCEDTYSCCPDYRTVCLDFLDKTSTREESTTSDSYTSYITSTAHSESTSEFSKTTIARITIFNGATTTINIFNASTTPTTTTAHAVPVFIPAVPANRIAAKDQQSNNRPRIAATTTTTAAANTKTTTTPRVKVISAKITPSSVVKKPAPATTTVKATVSTSKTLPTTTKKVTPATTKRKAISPATTQKTTSARTTTPTTTQKTTSARTTPTTTTTSKTTTPTMTTATTSVDGTESNQMKHQQAIQTKFIKDLPVRVPMEQHLQNQLHQSAIFLQVLFILVGTVALMGTIWLRCKHRLINVFQFIRFQPKDTESLPKAINTSSAVYKSTSAEPIAFIRTNDSYIRNNPSIEKMLHENPDTIQKLNSKQETNHKVAKNVHQDRELLLWEDDCSENEDNCIGIALHLKKSTKL